MTRQMNPFIRPRFSVHGIMIGAVLLAAFALASPAHAQNAPKVLGTYNAWTAYSSDESGSEVCFIVSDPKEKKLSRVGRKRGDVHFLVSNWPAQKIRNQPSVIIGYPFAPRSKPSVQIGSDKFELVLDPDNEAHEERAWVKDSMESKMIEAMRRGANMIVTGRSASGTISTDTYSLLGFTAALQRINKECN